MEGHHQAVLRSQVLPVAEPAADSFEAERLAAGIPAAGKLAAADDMQAAVQAVAAGMQAGPVAGTRPEGTGCPVFFQAAGEYRQRYL